MQARFVIDVDEKAQVPIISFSATSPTLFTTQSPFFIRTALDDNTMAKAIVTLVQAYGWHEIILVYEDTEYGSGLIPYLADEFQQFDIRVSFRFSISPNSTRLRILKMLIAKQMKVTLVHMTSSLGFDLFLLVKEVGMISEGYTWIIIDGLLSLLDPIGSKGPQFNERCVRYKSYVLQSKSLEKFKRKWKSGIHSNSTKLNIFHFWAYDTVWVLAMAVEMVRHDQSSNVIEQNCSRNASQFLDIRVSKVGRMIRNRSLHTTFKSLTGDFNLIKGLLQSSAFKIINVVDSEQRVIGYWTLENGLIGQLRKLGKVTYSTSMYKLKLPIWPGNTKVKPKGWSILVNGKKLRIEVLMKPGFDAYIKVECDPYTNESIVSKFSYDVFLEALGVLTFTVPHKVIPFTIDFGQSARMYIELLSQVNLQVH
ncbi:glutamate receptor 2.2-like [Herrania umbratica]|uniref:Glutamate receptor 2.2-like n=1 Tax=Herrania umbratica TaxID=108875 RepID=A0A6J1BKX7_9ROSI|nr:glutamate receptor 2.2-like [Herrania umbratica]